MDVDSKRKFCFRKTHSGYNILCWNYLKIDTEGLSKVIRTISRPGHSSHTMHLQTEGDRWNSLSRYNQCTVALSSCFYISSTAHPASHTDIHSNTSQWTVLFVVAFGTRPGKIPSHTSSYFGSFISFVRCSACTKTVSRFVSARRIASLIASGSVSPIAALNSVLVFRMTKFCRLGVGIFMAPLMSFLYKERAFVLVAGVDILVLFLSARYGFLSEDPKLLQRRWHTIIA